MPSSRQARMTRSAISPRHAIATHSKGGLTSPAPGARGTRRCPRGPPSEARRSAIASAARAACGAGSPSRRPAISGLGGAHRQRGRRAGPPRACARRPRRAPRRRRAPRGRCRSRRACSASNSSPVRKSARACDRPIARARTGEIVAGISPSRTSVKPKRASSRASTMSQQQASPVPPPSARHARARSRARAAVDGREHGRGRSASATLCSCASSPDARIHSRSAPAQNERAAPCQHDRAQRRRPPRTTANASCSAAISAASNALRRSGRSSQTRATPPARST